MNSNVIDRAAVGTVRYARAMKFTFTFLALSMIACGGKAKPAATSEPAPTAAAESCCCELPAEQPVFEMHPTKYCQEDMHGTCGDAAKCEAKP